MDKQQLIEHLKQLNPAECELVGRELAKSLPNAVGLLEGMVETFLIKECPNIHDIRHSRMHHFALAVNTRLIHCISALKSLTQGVVSGSHKVSYEEQAAAAIAAGSSPPAQQMS